MSKDVRVSSSLPSAFRALLLDASTSPSADLIAYAPLAAHCRSQDAIAQAIASDLSSDTNDCLRAYDREEGALIVDDNTFGCRCVSWMPSAILRGALTLVTTRGFVQTFAPSNDVKVESTSTLRTLSDVYEHTVVSRAKYFLDDPSSSSPRYRLDALFATCAAWSPVVEDAHRNSRVVFLAIGCEAGIVTVWKMPAFAARTTTDVSIRIQSSPYYVLRVDRGPVSALRFDASARLAVGTSHGDVSVWLYDDKTDVFNLARRLAPSDEHVDEVIWDDHSGHLAIRRDEYVTVVPDGRSAVELPESRVTSACWLPTRALSIVSRCLKRVAQDRTQNKTTALTHSLRAALWSGSPSTWNVSKEQPFVRLLNAIRAEMVERTRESTDLQLAAAWNALCRWLPASSSVSSSSQTRTTTDIKKESVKKERKRRKTRSQVDGEVHVKRCRRRNRTDVQPSSVVSTTNSEPVSEPISEPVSEPVSVPVCPASNEDVVQTTFRRSFSTHTRSSPDRHTDGILCTCHVDGLLRWWLVHDDGVRPLDTTTPWIPDPQRQFGCGISFSPCGLLQYVLYQQIDRTHESSSRRSETSTHYAELVVQPVVPLIETEACLDVIAGSIVAYVKTLTVWSNDASTCSPHRRTLLRELVSVLCARRYRHTALSTAPYRQEYRSNVKLPLPVSLTTDATHAKRQTSLRHNWIVRASTRASKTTRALTSREKSIRALFDATLTPSASYETDDVAIRNAEVIPRCYLSLRPMDDDNDNCSRRYCPWCQYLVLADLVDASCEAECEWLGCVFKDETGRRALRCPFCGEALLPTDMAT